MTSRTLLIAPLLCALLAAALPASAQSADAQKRKLAERVVAVWKPETVVVARMQQPAVNALEQSRIALQGRVTAEKQAATLQDISVDLQQYVDQVTPIALEAGKKEDQLVVVPMLMEKFSVEELQQIVAMLESPVRARFEAVMPQVQKALGDKIAADVGPQVDPKIKSLTEAVGTKLRHAAGQ